MDTIKIENGIRMVLDGLGILDRPGVEKTPRRVAMLYKEIFSGLEMNIRIDFLMYLLCIIPVSIAGFLHGFKKINQLPRQNMEVRLVQFS